LRGFLAPPNSPRKDRLFKKILLKSPLTGKI
jgi:hypothetical protein